MELSDFVNEFVEYEISCSNCSVSTGGLNSVEDAISIAEDMNFEIVDEENLLCPDCQ